MPQKMLLLFTLLILALASAAASQQTSSPAGGNMFATRSALAAASPSSGAAILGEPGREGLFRWAAGDQSARVSADPRQGVYIAPATDPKGMNGAWKRVMEHLVNVRWFGAVADAASGTTGADDYPAISAALDYLRLTSPIPAGEADFRPTGILYFPTGRYRVSKTIDITHTVRILGDSTGGNGGEATQLLFPANVDGIIVQRHNTFGAEGDGRKLPAHGSGEGSIIEGITVRADGDGARLASKACGFRLRARAELARCSAFYFAMDGFFVGASLDANTHPLGSSSLSKLDSCTAAGNGRHGFSFGGADGNAISVINFNAVLNGEYGYHDESFLGVHFFGGHSASNGQFGSGRYPTTSITYHNHAGSGRAGRWFVYHGRHEAASTTEPGTDDSVWVFKEPGGIDANYPQWVKGGAYVSGGSGCLAGGGSSHTGIYTEGGQGHLFIGRSAKARDGITGADNREFYGPGVYTKANLGAHEVHGAVRATKSTKGRTIESYIGGDVTDGQFAGFSDSAHPNHYYYRIGGGEVSLSRSNSPIYLITSPHSAAGYARFGRTGTVPDAFVAPRFALPNESGPSGAHRIQAYASAPPAGTNFGTREVRWNDGTNPAYEAVDYWIWKGGAWVARP